MDLSAKSQHSRPEPAQAMSPHEYFTLDKSDPTLRYELIGGKVYALSGRSVGHDAIAFNVRAALAQHFRSGP